MDETASGGWPQDTAGRWLRIAVVVAAALGQGVVLLPFTAASGLVAPLWAVVALLLLWVAASFVLARVARHRPLATPLVPVANFALWWLAMFAGEGLLGWTP